MCCFDKSFNPVSCPRQSFECDFNDPIALPAIEFDATKRKLGKKPSGKLVRPLFHLSIKSVSNPARSLNRQYYNNNYNYNNYGGRQNAGYSNYGNGNAYRNQQQNFGNGGQEFDYYALVVDWPEMICRDLDKTGKACNMPNDVEDWTIKGLWPQKNNG